MFLAFTDPACTDAVSTVDSPFAPQGVCYNQGSSSAIFATCDKSFTHYNFSALRALVATAIDPALRLCVCSHL